MSPAPRLLHALNVLAQELQQLAVLGFGTGNREHLKHLAC
jgi:hypothetical protein